MFAQPIHRYILFAILVAIGGWGIIAEKIPVNNNTGWDGKHYANLTIHFEELAAQKQIDSYQYQRILTPTFLFYTAKLFHVPLNISNIATVYSVFNFILILLSALFFFKTSTHLHIRTPTEIIGFCGLFFNYFILKNTAYYPVLTDVTAFFIGMCITCFFITQQNTALFFTVLLAQFCYPLLLVVSMPLALGIRNNTISLKLTRLSVFKILSIALMLLFQIGIYIILYISNTLLPRYTMELNIYLLPVSIALACGYIWQSISNFQLTQKIDDGIVYWKTALVKLLGAVIFWLCVNHFISRMSIPEDVFTSSVFLYNIVQQSIDNPLIFLVAHIIYLGPLLFLVFFFYQSFIQTITSLGDSAIAYFLITVVLSIGSETRQFIHFYPFIVIVIMLTINHHNFTTTKAILFGLVSIVASKFWLPINTPDIFNQYVYDKFPEQYYFMNHGPFMSGRSYIINLVVVVTLAILSYYLIKYRATERSSATL